MAIRLKGVRCLRAIIRPVRLTKREFRRKYPNCTAPTAQTVDVGRPDLKRAVEQVTAEAPEVTEPFG